MFSESTGILKNPHKYLQSNKRLTHSGQKHTVSIHHIMDEDSINGHIFDKLTNKVDAQQRLLDYLKND
jgi:SNF2 family DNA or RNA helicase